MTTTMDSEARWRKQWSIERSRGLKRVTSPERAQAHVQALTPSTGSASGPSPMPLAWPLPRSANSIVASVQG
jgi:hypothetical protein